MKRILALILTFALALPLLACGSELVVETVTEQMERDSAIKRKELRKERKFLGY